MSDATVYSSSKLLWQFHNVQQITNSEQQDTKQLNCPVSCGAQQPTEVKSPWLAIPPSSCSKISINSLQLSASCHSSSTWYR